MAESWRSFQKRHLGDQEEYKSGVVEILNDRINTLKRK
jgi:hypothetical protein